MAPNITNEPPSWTKFAIAGFGGFSGWLFVHPFDVLKVRMQINEGKSVNAFRVFSGIFKSEGIPGLYSGLSAATARQFSYTTSRIGLYDVFTSHDTLILRWRMRAHEQLGTLAGNQHTKTALQ